MDNNLARALEQEHREIDAGIAAFVESLEQGQPHTAELTRAFSALRRHIYLEEEFLFPPLRESGMLPPVLVMLREHGEIWRAMDALQRRASPERCRELLDQLGRHNDKEEAIIYPEGDARLEDAAKQRLHGFISSGKMPDGWVCRMA